MCGIAPLAGSVCELLALGFSAILPIYVHYNLELDNTRKQSSNKATPVPQIYTPP